MCFEIGYRRLHLLLLRPRRRCLASGVSWNGRTLVTLGLPRLKHSEQAELQLRDLGCFYSIERISCSCGGGIEEKKKSRGRGNPKVEAKREPIGRSTRKCTPLAVSSSSLQLTLEISPLYRLTFSTFSIFSSGNGDSSWPLLTTYLSAILPSLSLTTYRR